MGEKSKVEKMKLFEERRKVLKNQLRTLKENNLVPVEFELCLKNYLLQVILESEEVFLDSFSSWLGYGNDEVVLDSLWDCFATKISDSNNNEKTFLKDKIVANSFMECLYKIAVSTKTLEINLEGNVLDKNKKLLTLDFKKLDST